MIKKYKILLVCCLFLTSAPAFSSGVITIDGKLRAFDSKTISIESKDFIFVIEKAEIDQAQLKMAKSKHVGAPLTLIVPFQALSQAKDVAHN